MIVLIILLVLIFIFIGVIISTYNKLIKLKNKVKNSWGHIDAQLQRRFDLIPNLVDIIRNVTEHEEQILEKVMSIRNQFSNASSNNEKISIDTELSSCLRALYDVIGGNPQLKSSTHFIELQRALTEIEEDISYARQFYNDSVTIYNNALMSFPNNIIASMFDFKEETLFDAVKGAEKAPVLRFKIKHQCPQCGAIIKDKNAINCEYCGCSLY